MKIRSLRGILNDTINKNQLPDDITTIFYDWETGEEIGYSFEDEGDWFIPVEMFDDYNEWKTVDGAISLDGWEGGIIGHCGSHLVYDTNEAITYASRKCIKKIGGEYITNDLEETMEFEVKAYDDWSYNVLGILPTLPLYSRPFIISFSAN